MQNNNIPKTIHFCWFGKSELPELARKCIESWEKYLPDYNIVKWDEDNFDINQNLFVQQAYENKKFAFVTDYVRLYALDKFGGVYMDTDVEVIKSLDKFLIHSAFTGYESKETIPTGIMGASKGSVIIRELLAYYNDRPFIQEDGSFDTKTNVRIVTDYFIQHGFIPDNELKTFKGLTIYPKTYFCPLEWNGKKSDFSHQTHTIHHFAGSWLDEKEKKRKKSFIWKNFGYLIGLSVNVSIRLLGENKYKSIKKKLRI